MPVKLFGGLGSILRGRARGQQTEGDADGAGREQGRVGGGEAKAAG